MTDYLLLTITYQFFIKISIFLYRMSDVTQKTTQICLERTMTMKKLIVGILIISLLASSLSVYGKNTNENKADLVIFGTMYTSESENAGLAEAFAVKNGKYVYVGDKEGVKPYIQEGVTKIVNQPTEGLIIPGCTEGHGHYFDGTGLNSQLPGCNCSYDEVLKIIKEQVATKNIKQFVSFGWDSYSLVEKRKSGFNFAEEIENVAPGIPVVLMDNTGHGAVCNTTALQKSGLLDKPEVRGGAVELDKNGKPNGYISDQASSYVIDKVIKEPLTDEQYKNACNYGMNKLLSLGYTNALDAYTNMYDPTGLYKALKKMDNAGELKINVAGCYNIKSYDSDIYQKKVDEVADIVNKYSGSHFNPAYIKLFTDGIVESGTGWIENEYKYAENGKEHGNIIWNQDELNAITQYANSKNIIIHTHAYGDAAVKSTINAYISSNEANKNEYRNCLAHVRNIQDEDIIRAATNKIPIAENLIWHTDFDERIPYEKAIKKQIIDNIGEDLYYSGYPMKSLIKNGVIVSSSTDAPAAETIEGNIMNVLEVAVTGIIPGENSPSFAKDELLTVKEGLQALTINGAWQLGLEKERGSVKVGKYADFVILDKNILNYKGKELRTIGDTKILSTYFEGENVYSAEP